MPPGSERGALIDPEGRHKGLFLPCKATDAWAWNEAVFRHRLHRGRDGAVYRRLDAARPDLVLGEYVRVWPEPGEPVTASRGAFEELGGSDRTT